MAEHPVILDNENRQVKILIKQPTNKAAPHVTESVVDNKPSVAEPKKTFKQRLTSYAFGEEVAEPGKYVWKSYLEPTGKRVANDIVEHFLLMIKHTFQRWIWHGKISDDGKWIGDRTSFSNYSRGPEPIKASVQASPVKDLTFDKQSDAEKVLAYLKDVAQQENGMVSVRDYYEASGRPELVETNGVSSSSGWKKEVLDKVTVKSNPEGGYSVSLPRPISLT